MPTTCTGAKAHQSPLNRKPGAARTLAFLALLILPWLFLAGRAAAQEVEVQAVHESDEMGEARGRRDLDKAREPAEADEARETRVVQKAQSPAGRPPSW